jgi:hypothetical protein
VAGGGAARDRDARRAGPVAARGSAGPHGLIGQALTQQATLLAYIDVFCALRGRLSHRIAKPPHCFLKYNRSAMENARHLQCNPL